MAKNGENPFEKYTKLEYMAEEHIALNREVNLHPELVKLLLTYAPDDEGGIMGEIAAYCGIAMEGAYNQMELNQVRGICLQNLQGLRNIKLKPSIKLH
jgi:hypothetical protein